MRLRNIFLASTLALGAAVGCYTGNHVESWTPGSTTTDAPATIAADLPCDVAALLSAQCTSCHGASPTGGARISLVSAENLRAPSKTDPKISVAAEAIARMKDTAEPMPPDGLRPATEVGVLEAWVAAGMPAGTCAVEGGADTNTPTVCTSNTFWTRRDHGSENMHPGGTCIGCHSTSDEEDAKIYSLAGTLFPTAHEPDDCNGVNGTSTGAKVVVTDATGQVVTMSVNGVGNFHSSRAITPPYTAKVVVGDKVRTMKTAQTDGDCNSCHTERGTQKAPGRIFAP